MGRQRNASLKLVASAQVHTGQGAFAGGMVCSTGANQVLVEVFDGTDDTGVFLGLGRTTTAGESAEISPVSGDQVVYNIGLYVKISGTAPVAIVYYDQLK